MKKINIALGKNSRIFWTYFIPLFCYTTFPTIQVFFPYNSFSGSIANFYILFFLGLNISSLAILRSTSLTSSKDKFLKKILILLAFISLISFLLGSTESESYWLLTIRWLRDTGKLIFLSIHFLIFPFILSDSFSTQRKYQRMAILLNALILPFLYISFGQFSGSLLYVGNLRDYASDYEYNNYLALGDSLLFNTSLLLIILPNVFSYLINLISATILILIGSRVSFLFALLALLLYAPFVFKFVSFGFTASIKDYLNPLKTGFKVPKNIFFILIAVFLTLLTLLFGDLSYLLPQGILSKVESLINIDTIESSRVWLSIFEQEDVLSDGSLNDRLELFYCHLENIYTNYTFKDLLFGKSWQETSCISYSHSSISILFENGLLVFYLVFYLVQKRVKLLINVLRNNSIVSIYHVLYAIFLIVFLLIGLTARAGLGFFLPALMFPWLNLNPMNLRSERV
jgi:hypothetical protein